VKIFDRPQTPGGRIRGLGFAALAAAAIRPLVPAVPGRLIEVLY
jgi:hypothetical protein